MNDPVLTLRWFLNCPEIDNLEFFGDEDCLGNPITGVNVIDNPEGVPWIKKNELVLTTGFIFYKDIALTKKLLKELHDVSCTALCIKIKRFYVKRHFSVIFYAEIDKIQNLFYNESQMNH